MRILVVTQYFWPENFRINDLCLELSERGHDVFVLTSTPNYPEGELFFEFKQDRRKFDKLCDVTVYRVPQIPRGNNKFFLLLNYLSFMISSCLLGPILLFGKKFDLVFVCQLSPPTVLFPGIIISKLKGVPLGMWILDLWPESLRALGITKNRYLLSGLQRIMNFAYSQSDVIFTQSESFKKQISFAYKSPIEIVHVPTWAEEEFKNPKLTPLPEMPFNDNEFKITFAGNIGRAQDMDCIIDASKILASDKKIKIYIVGDGRDLIRVRKHISDCKLDEIVKVMGRQPLSSMPSFFSASDALLVTLADDEVFAFTIPGKLQSYMAFGKPVIGAINGEARDVILGSQCGFCVESGDSKGLANAIKKMARMSKKEREIMGTNGRIYYKKFFDRKIIIDKIESRLLMLLEHNLSKK